jgi:PBP1b-binding outer membrane lipoprotein LpoB
MKKVYIFTLFGVLFFLNGCSTSHAIKQDSKEAWKGTREVSKEAWHGTKDVSKKAWKDSKKAVHNATAE